MPSLIISKSNSSPEDNSNDEEQNDRSITLLGSNWMQTFSWVPNYVFDKEHNFKTFLREKNLPIQDGEKVMALVDKKILISSYFQAIALIPLNKKTSIIIQSYLY
jgi:hypothetical protein